MRMLVIDGNSIVNRAFYGIRPLTTKDGQFTNAIYGFLTMLTKIKNEENPDAVAIAFDLKAPTFRHKAYAGYKATRKGMPEELASQIKPLKELLQLLGYTLVTCEGYEADDILGTFAKACEKNGNECVIATGDRDSLQLVSDTTTVHLCTNKQDISYTPAKILEDYGVTPKQLIEIKAIQGDSSDNIPGVAGIGPKGAGDLISRFGSVDYIYSHIDEIDVKDGIRNKLKNSEENAKLSRMLGEIFCEVPINTNVEDYKVELKDPEECARFMAKLELFSLIDKLGLKEMPTAEEKPATVQNFEVVENADANVLYENIKKQGKVYFKTDFSDIENPVCNILFDGKVYIVKDNEFFDKLLENEEILKFTHGSKTVFAYADKKNIEVKSLAFDIELAAYLIEPSSKDYSDENLCGGYGITLPKNEKFSELSALAVYDVLCEKLKKDIDTNEQEKLLTDIEIPLAKVLAKMENIGFAVDRQGIEDYGKILHEQIKNLENEIYTSIGYEFNINSPKQLGVILFEKMQLPNGKKTKTGFSTSAEVLEKLAGDYPIVADILEYRKLSKLKSTYADGLSNFIDATGKIHTTFHQTITATGRLSSTDPNLQNIPIRIELGKMIRKVFHPMPGDLFVDSDYSQIELRLLAHMSGDEQLIEAFRENQDIHRSTASKVFHVPFDEVTDLQRRNAKAVNFGIVYGISAYGLSQDLNIGTKEAQGFIDSYFETYPKIKEFLDNTVAQAKEKGYTRTLFGRIRPIPELSSGNFMTRQFGERVAMNAPIQGTAADIIKIAMIRVHDRLIREHFRSRLILQVHDELLIETAEEEKEKVIALLEEEMQKAADLKVELAVGTACGQDWYEAH